MVRSGKSGRTLTEELLLMYGSVRYAQQVTAFPAGITTGSTWDTQLIYARGYALGTS